MSSRPSSRATAGDESTATLRSSTAKRPLTKPVAPRLSAGSTATKPTSTSAARTSTTTSSSLSKPPARPSSATSTAKRPPSAAATNASSLHRTRPSVTSVDASGDESKRDGITAKPKRMSLAASTNGEKSSTATGRTTAATPLRKTSSTTTSGVVRPSAKSPTSTTKTAASTPIRPSTTVTPRTRPLSTSTTRTGPGVSDRKRLSTIPASPAVKGTPKAKDENKDNEILSESEKLPVRPTLGTRKSTRSVLIEQRIHEFELVNQMLRSAMTADGMDDEEEQQIQQQTEKTMESLRSDLAKVRIFEKENGRLPTEAELAEVGDVPVDLVAESKNLEDEVAGLKEELEESQAQVEQLKTHLTEMTARMEYFGKSAEEESEKVREATITIRSEHANKIEEIVALYKSQIEELKAAHQTQLDSKLEQHHSELEALQKSRERELSHKDEALDTLRAKLKDAGTKTGDVVSSDNAELSEARKQLKDYQDRHQAAKDNAKSKMANALEGHQAEINQLEAQHASQVAEMQRQVDDALSHSKSQEHGLSEERDAHSGTREMLQIVRDELDHLNKTKEEAAEEHQKTVAQLQEQVTALEQANVTASELAGQSLQKLKMEHQEHSEKLQAQLLAADDRLQKTTELSEKKESEAIERLKDELKAAQKELVSAKDAHTTLTEDFQRKFENATKTKESAELMQEEELHSLRAQLEEANRSIQTQEVDSAKQLESLKSLLDSKSAQIESLKTDHEHKLADLQAQSETAHHAALSKLKQMHAEQAGQLEEQSKSALQDLESLESSNNAAIEHIRTSAAAEQKTALDEQAASHKIIVSGLEGQLASMQNDFADLKARHDDELNKLQSHHSSDKESALAALTSEHQQALAEYTMQSKTADDALTALQASHTGETTKFESQIRDMSVELDAARFQVQSLKGILQSIEQEGHEKDDEHQKELAKKDEDFSQAISKLSTQSMRIAELETAQHQAIEQAKAAGEAETQKSLAALKQEHDEKLDVLRKSFEEEHKSTLEKLQAEHSKAIESLTKDIKLRDQDVEQLKADHSRALTDLQATSQQGNADALEKLNSEHSAALDDLRSSLHIEHTEQVTQAEETHAQTIEDNAKRFAEVLDHTKHEFNSMVASLRLELEQAHMKLADTTELDALNVRLDEGQQALSKLQEEHAGKLSALKKQHAAELSELLDELQTLRQKATESADTSELDSIKSKLKYADTKIAELTDLHVKAIGKKDLEHADMLEAIQSQLKEAQATAASDVQSANEAEETKGLLANAERTIAELSEQYAAAAMDAENQRVATESARKELADFKKSVSEASVVPNVSNSSPKVKVKDSNGSTMSPKGGLKASKWAATEPDQSGTDQEELAAQDDAGTPQKPRSKARNVTGQMAGIQESIRQLTEMNDEMLEDHQKWARTLSRVDDDGTISVTESLDEYEKAADGSQ